MECFLGKRRYMECICRQVTSVHWQKIQRAGMLPGTSPWLVSQQLDPPGPERHRKEPKPHYI